MWREAAIGARRGTNGLSADSSEESAEPRLTRYHKGVRTHLENVSHFVLLSNLKPRYPGGERDASQRDYAGWEPTTFFLHLWCFFAQKNLGSHPAGAHPTVLISHSTVAACLYYRTIAFSSVSFVSSRFVRKKEKKKNLGRRRLSYKSKLLAEPSSIEPKVC